MSGWGVLSANNYRIIRYGHILLWLAECEVELDGLEKARALVNQIRTRAANPANFVQKIIHRDVKNDRDGYKLVTDAAGKPVPAGNYIIKNYTSPWTDAATARKAVRFETRLELAMEGHRFFDLQRW